MLPEVIAMFLLAMVTGRVAGVFIAQEIPSIRDRIYSDELLENLTTVNEIDCARRCMHADGCLTLFYKKDTNECQLHGNVSNTAGDGYTISPGWRNYERGTIKWELTLHTSDRAGAGTDAYVAVRLGNENYKAEQFINLVDNEDDKERSSVDKYNFGSNISNPNWLEFQLTTFGPSPGWHLEKLMLKNEPTGKVYEVYVNDWLKPESVPIVRRFSLQ